MSAHFQRVMAGLRLKAERDLRLSRGSDAAAHLRAYGAQPWPRPADTRKNTERP